MGKGILFNHRPSPRDGTDERERERPECDRKKIIYEFQGDLAEGC
jgi:hypothetical protein